MLSVPDEDGEALIDNIESIGVTDEDYPSSQNRQEGSSFTPDNVKDYDWGNKSDKRKF